MIKSTHLLVAAVSLLTAAVTCVPATAADFETKDYETPAYIDLELGEIQVDEASGTVLITILRTGDFRQTTTIEYQTTEDSASEGQDYKGAGGSLTFKPGEGFKTVTLEILPDDEKEALESFIFEIVGSSPNTMVMRSAATVVISDLAAAATPRLEIAPAPSGQILLAWEGNERSVIERTTNPAAGVWEAVPCYVTVNGDRCEALQPAGEGYFFYRLRMP
jgi:hypothetical protein